MTAMLVVIIMRLIIARWRNAPKQDVLDFYGFDDTQGKPFGDRRFSDAGLTLSLIHI